MDAGGSAMQEQLPRTGRFKELKAVMPQLKILRGHLSVISQ